MPKLNISIPHQLPQDDALTRVKGLLGRVKQDHADKFSNLQEDWIGNAGTFSFAAMGFLVSGRLAVNASAVEINAELPFAASLFKGKIEAAIRENLAALLA